MSATATALVESPVSKKRESDEPRTSSLLSAGFFRNAQPLDLSMIGMDYSVAEGFSYPNWKSIRENIHRIISKEQRPQAWREIGKQWLDQLKEDLGGEYRQYESWNFLLLSAEGQANSEMMLEIAEHAVEAVESQMDFLISRQKLYGKRVLLVFSEQDDYYSYISHYFPDGEHSTSSGVFIQRGYGHIAMPFNTISQIRRVILHELTHNCLMGLRLPVWLNEGFSRRIENSILAQHVILTRELATEHRDYWNEQNIQSFWAGTSFYRPDEGNRLSYNLGEILVEVLSDNWADFLTFVQNADVGDGGQDAALKCLGKCLSETMTGFLGPGSWRPNRKAITELWAQRKKENPNCP